MCGNEPVQLRLSEHHGRHSLAICSVPVQFSIMFLINQFHIKDAIDSFDEKEAEDSCSDSNSGILNAHH